MKQIQLLLTETVDNLGIVGDVVKVRPGYARNFLLPRGMATKPTPGAVKALAAKRAVVEKEMALRRGALEAMFEKLKNHEITVMRSANEQGILFGGVSQHDIAQALRDEGHTVEDRMVRIGMQIKRLDTYHIPLVLANDLRTELKLWVVSDKPSDQLAPNEGKKDEAAAEGEAAERKEKREKPARAARGEKSDTSGGEGAEKDDKAEKGEKPEKRAKGEKAAKGEKSDKAEGGDSEKPKKAKKSKADAEAKS